MKRRTTPLLLAMLACLLPAVAAAQAAGPVVQASVQDLIEALSESSNATKSFRPTRRPGPDGLCGDQPAARSSATKTLVVEYADDTAPQVELAIQYALESDRLNDASVRLLDNLALALRSPELQGYGFALAGHTDVSGTHDLNLRLSCARALAALDHLVGKGVHPDRLTAYGFGSSQLLAGHPQSSGVHRRVEVRRAAAR